jgi:hypothetical protein
MYAPRLCREVFLVCLNRLRQVALIQPVPAQPSGAWTLPGARLREQESYAQAAERLASPYAPLGPMRWASVEGRVAAQVPTATRERRREARVNVVHVGTAATSLHSHGDGLLLWTPHKKASAALTHLHVPELDLFIEGYLDSWIPDGWITLE